MSSTEPNAWEFHGLSEDEWNRLSLDERVHYQSNRAAKVRSTYQSALPAVFPYGMTVNPLKAVRVAAFLIERGSSFAVTMDEPVSIWLSDNSLHLMITEWKD